MVSLLNIILVALVAALLHTLLTPYTPIPLHVDEFNAASNVAEEEPASISSLSAEVRQWHSRGSFVQVLREHNMFVVDLGDPLAAPCDTLMLVHGFPSSSFDWRLCVDVLLQRRFKRVIAMDLLGFGFSDKPHFFSYSITEQADALEQLIAHKGIQGAHVLSHDMGDTVLCELLYRRDLGLMAPRFALQSVTFTNGGMRLELASLRLTQQLLRIRPLGALMPRVTNWWLFNRQIRSLNLREPHKIPEREVRAMWELLHYKRGIHRVPLINDYLNQRFQFQHKWLRPLRRLTCPVHILWGQQDAVAPKQIALTLKTSDIPQATHSFLDLGHFLMLEDSRMFSEAVLWFYNGAGLDLFKDEG